MIYTKRQIKTQDDRYGGYAETSELNIGRADSLSEINTEVQTPQNAKRDVLNELMYGTPDTKIGYDEKIEIKQDPEKAATKADGLYTTRETLGKTAEPDNSKLDKSDVMPTLQTLRYADKRADLDAMPQKSKRARVDGKTKVLLCVYVAIALALAVAVIATGVSISTANADSAALANSIAQKQELIVNQQNTIAELTNEATIRDEAINAGMVYAEGGATAERVDKIDYPEAEPHTNPFDKFCDWLSKL